jgi:hypothetical protein
MTAQRYDVRIHRVMKVKVSGTDTSGNRFRQTASTINISRSGARLDGVPTVDRSQPFELSRGWFKRARFRVVWSGAPGTIESSQVGVRCLDPNSSGFWGIEFPPPQPSNWKPANAAAAAAAIPESGPIPVQWDSYDTSRPSATARNRAGVIHPADAQPTAWKEEASTVAGDKRVPVTLRWSAQGKEVEETLVMARVLKDGSCMLSLKNSALEGTEVQITHGYSGEQRTGRVSWCGPRAADGGCPAAIELTPPDPKFWEATPSFSG